MDPQVLRWRTLIVDTARRYWLSPALVAGLIQVESGGDPEAVSNAGAVGLMQVMPAEYIEGRPPAYELQEVAFNLEWGCKLLAEYRQRTGCQAGMLAAYYGAVDAEGRPTRAHDGSGVDGWGYVKRVERTALDYYLLDQDCLPEYREWAPHWGSWQECADNLRGVADDALRAGRELARTLHELSERAEKAATGWKGR